MSSAAAQAQEKRIALVVGNGAYAKSPLATAANDAGLIAQTLQAAGFDVIGARDLDGDTLRKSFRDFIQKAESSGPDTVAMVYLSGYGLQLAGDNYFVPVDSAINRETDVPIEALRTGDYIRQLASLPLKAGIVVLDIADRAKPKLITHQNWSPPFGGGTHNCLPLPDRELLVVLDEAVLDHQEDGLKLIWVFDNRVPKNPVSISTFPTPAEADYKAKGAHFGPHNVHENRPGSFISSQLIFATYQNAGIRVFDMSDAFAPKEVGALVPPQPNTLADTRPNRARVIQSADVFVDAKGLIYATDYNAGLYILEFDGA